MRSGIEGERDRVVGGEIVGWDELDDANFLHWSSPLFFWDKERTRPGVG